jgi:O-antigen ligase
MDHYQRPTFSDIILSGILITLPFSITVTNFLIIIAMAWSLFKYRRGMVNEMIASGRAYRFLWTTLPFFFIVISLLYTDDLKQGLKSVEKYLPLLSFPVVFSLIQSKRSPIFFARIFGITVLGIAIICLAYALYNFYFLPEEAQQPVGDNYSMIQSKWNALSNTSLMQPFNINPIYMALYVSFALFTFLFDPVLKTYAKLAVMALLILFQFLVSSRIGIVALSISVCIMIILWSAKIKRYSKAVSFVLAIVVAVCSLLITFNPILKKRFIVDFTNYQLPNDVGGWNGLNIRYAIWKCSVDLIEKSPVIGYGIGTQYEVREACYRNYTFYGPFGEHLNCHNQYLEYSLIGGGILFLLFLFQIFDSLRHAIFSKTNLHILLLTLIVITCLGESLLETHKGIVFFGYFNSLFLFDRHLEKRDEISKKSNIIPQKH